MKKIHHIALSLLMMLVLQVGSGASANEASQNIGSEPQYVDITIHNLSKLYWALGKLTFENDSYIDQFMKLNECEIYKDYYENEIAWSEIRKSARSMIKSKIKEFPIHFQITREILLTEYDQKRQVFDVDSNYKIQDTNMFEVVAPRLGKEERCLAQSHNPKEGYPAGLVVLLPRPISVTEVKMANDMAEAYISMKNGEVANARFRTKATRNAFVVLKLKFFYLEEDDFVNQSGEVMARALAAVEKMEIYADAQHKFLLYSEEMRARKSVKNAEDVFKERQKMRAEERKKEISEPAAEGVGAG